MTNGDMIKRTAVLGLLAGTIITISACSYQSPVIQPAQTYEAAANPHSPPENQRASKVNPATNSATHLKNSIELLHQHQWQLIQLMQDKSIKGKGGKPISLRLDSAKQLVSGFGGCNRYFGSYSVEQNTLTFGHLAMTKMLCQQGMALEAKFAKTMGQVATYRVTPKSLNLFVDKQGNTLAVFKKD